MKMAVFGVEEEEQPILLSCAEKFGIDLVLNREYISLAYLQHTDRIDAINVLSDTVITPAMWDAAYAAGVRFAVTRCVGMAHMNADYAARLGIATRNVHYSAASVADYTIMMMLMVLRNVKPMLQRYTAQEYLQYNLRGRELPNLTVGIIGAGNIGQTLAVHLSGFGCRVVYWNRTPKESMRAEYLLLDRLLAQSDIVSLHLTLNPETQQIINRDTIAKMKQGAVLINTGRGGLVDTAALIEALESGHLSGAAMDVLDGDQNIYYRDHKNRVIPHHEKAILDSMPNVLMLPHLGYLTDQALYDMVNNSLIAAKEWETELTRQ